VWISSSTTPGWRCAASWRTWRCRTGIHRKTRTCSGTCAACRRSCPLHGKRERLHRQRVFHPGPRSERR
jgi:hypothetical protein